MGVALAKLHNVPVATNAPVGKSWWYADNIIGSALAQLALVDGQMPPKWQPLHNAMRTTLETAQHWTHLPRTIIHGDAWAGNAVQTGPNDVVLIDWDPSGIGWPLLDLARLLIQSPVDLSTPVDVVLQPDLQRIDALVDGYCTHRVPSGAEIAVLPESVRFTAAAGGAWHFMQGPHKGWQRVGPILARRQHRYDVSDAFASVAHKRLEQHM
jgi:aminoglycoside phosphotransferase (APT) family kinase protein